MALSFFSILFCGYGGFPWALLKFVRDIKFTGNITKIIYLRDNSHYERFWVELVQDLSDYPLLDHDWTTLVKV